MKCGFDGCGRRRFCKGLCSGHYQQQLAGKELQPLRYIRHHPELNFPKFLSMSRAGDCWLWTGVKVKGGYGRFKGSGSKVLAHRWSYEYHVAEIPEGLELDHLCRRPSCVNPWHLEPVTPEVNQRRKYEHPLMK